MTDIQKQIFDYLNNKGSEGTLPKEVAKEVFGKSDSSSTGKHLRKMVIAGHLEKLNTGEYRAKAEEKKEDPKPVAEKAPEQKKPTRAEIKEARKARLAEKAEKKEADAPAVSPSSKITTPTLTEKKDVPNLFDFEIEVHPIYTKEGTPIPDFKQITDGELSLNVCRKTYTPMYNKDFSMLADDLAEILGKEVAEAKSFMDNKRQLVFFDPSVDAIEGLEYENQLILGNSHDCSTGVFIGIKNTFLRCSNQFFVANKKADFKIYHTLSLEKKLPQILKAVEVYAKMEADLKDDFLSMLKSKTKVTEEVIQDFLNDINYVSNPEKISTRKQNIIHQQKNCIIEEAEDLGMNPFALFNGITKFTSHIKQVKRDKELATVNGTINDLNQVAFTTAMKLAI